MSASASDTRRCAVRPGSTPGADHPGRAGGPLERRRRFGAAATALAVLGTAVLAACGGSAPATPQAPPATLAPSVAVVETPAAVATRTPDPTAEPTPTPTPVPPDPCSLLTRDEANRLAGVKLREPMQSGDPPSLCVWPAPLSGSVAQVEVGLGDGAKKFLDIDKDILKHDFAQVAGLGDEAWVEDDTVFVRVGETWFSLHLVGHAGTSKYRPKLEALAQTILGRLAG